MSYFPTLTEYFSAKAAIDGKKRVVRPFHRDIMDALTDLVLGRLPGGKTKLAINMPPGHGKTWIMESFLEWSMGIFPDARNLYLSYSEELAEQSTANVKAALNHEEYQKVFEDVALSDYKKRDFFRTSSGGYVYAAGLQGTIRGYRAGQVRREYGGAIFIDDPLKAAGTDCSEEAKKAFNVYTNMIEGRRMTTATPIVAIGQRVGPDDFFSQLLAAEKNQWHVLKYPCLNDKGDALWPEVKSREYWLNLQNIDELAFWAQGMQEPRVPGGNMIKRHWWKFYNPDNYDVDGLVIITADTALKRNDRSDNHSFQCWCLTATHCDLLDEVTGKWDFPTSLRKADEFWRKWQRFGVSGFYIEEKASGIPMASMLDQIHIPCVLWSPSRYQFPVDKIGRVKFSNFYIEAGRVRLPINSPISDHLIDQAAGFTGDEKAKDDSVDAMTMAVSIWKTKGGGWDVQTQ